MNNKLLTGALLCSGPLIIIPVARATYVFGPCSDIGFSQCLGMRNMGAGLFLFGVATSGVVAVVLGFYRLARIQTHEWPLWKTLRILSALVGVVSITTNALFVLLTGWEFMDMLRIAIR